LVSKKNGNFVAEKNWRQKLAFCPKYC
jgi:hypothetical protein